MMEGDFSTNTFYSNLRGKHSQLRNTPCLPQTQAVQMDTCLIVSCLGGLEINFTESPMQSSELHRWSTSKEQIATLIFLATRIVSLSSMKYVKS